ncbi:MAG: phosphoglycolate phosphatase [Methanothrix sp.]|nr:phosphoglycolate phosphatase [Methanothrix sp.]MDD4447501.1 phosphoglycolate phosphatase [Methanothrix sp.]
MGVIRALVVDIDGTLSDQNRVLCPSALQALRRLKVPVVLSTGNTHCFTRTVSVLLGTPRIFIAENGGVLSYSEDEMEILADLKVCEDAFEKLAAEFPLQKYNSARYRFTDIALQRTFDAKAADKRAQELGLPVEVIDTTYAVHIKDKRIDKGTGLIRIAKRMNIDLGEFAAIGDSNSDLPMYRLAGFRASVGNAGPELKQDSDYVAKAEYGNGFAEIINYMNEKGMF